MNRKAKARRGKGILDATAIMVLSNKHNRLMSRECHQIYLPDGTYNPARYSGPGTQLDT